MTSKTSSETLGRTIRKTQEVNSDIQKSDIENILPQGVKEELYISNCRFSFVKKIYDNTVLVFDNDSQGDWDDYNWAYDDDTDETNTIFKVYNDNNIFYEHLQNNLFIDSALTTATYTSTGLLFTSGQRFQSTEVALEPFDKIIACTFNILSQDIDITNLTFSVTNNDITWSTITPGEPFNFTEKGKLIKYRIDKSSSAGTDYINVDPEIDILQINYTTAQDIYKLKISEAILPYVDTENSSGVLINEDANSVTYTNSSAYIQTIALNAKGYIWSSLINFESDAYYRLDISTDGTNFTQMTNTLQTNFTNVDSTQYYFRIYGNTDISETNQTRIYNTYNPLVEVLFVSEAGYTLPTYTTYELNTENGSTMITEGNDIIQAEQDRVNQ